MTPRFSISACLAIALLAAGPAFAGEVIDGIVATVNGHIILQSDWENALNYEAFIGGKPLDQLSLADRKATLDRLIDQELLREQLRSTDAQHGAADDDVLKRIHEVRKQYSGAENEQGWKNVLTRYGLSETELQKHVALQLDLLRLVDDRFRPTVQIDDKSIESYYNQSLLPQLRQSGAGEVPLADVTPKIRELLTQQKMDELVTSWLQTLRSTSEIRTGGLSVPVGSQAQ